MLAFILIVVLSVSVIYGMPSDLREAANLKNNGTANCAITEYVLGLQHLCGYESIHGLWPDPQSACDTCTTEKFSTSQLSASTLAGMNKY